MDTGLVAMLCLSVLGQLPPTMGTGDGLPRLWALGRIERVVLEPPAGPEPAPDGTTPPPANTITERATLDALAAALRGAPGCGGTCWCKGELVVKLFVKGKREPVELWLKEADDMYPTRVEIADMHSCVRISETLADQLRDAVVEPGLAASIAALRHSRHMAIVGRRWRAGGAVVLGCAGPVLLCRRRARRRRTAVGAARPPMTA